MDELLEEMARRTERDGIPRRIVDGKIMKLDWELSEPVDPSPETLEEHIANLLGRGANG